MKSLFLSIWITLLSTSLLCAALPGDITNDGAVDLKDCIVALQVTSGSQNTGLNAGAGVDRDNKVGLADALYALQAVIEPPPSFPILWPFPNQTEIRGIVHFDHSQSFNFNPYHNDANGAGMTYFCKSDATMPRFQHLYGDHGEYLVGITDGHRGNDFFIALNTPVLAVADGTVILETGHPVEEDRVKIVHDNGWITLYAHNIVRNTALHNQRVEAGNQIGTMANTGTGGVVTINNTNYYELHFEIYRPNSINNPQYSSVDPYYGPCSNGVANPEGRVYFVNGVPLPFIPDYFE